MTLVDIINMPAVSDPQLSPDGRDLLFVRSDASWKEDKRVSHNWEKAPAESKKTPERTALR